MNYDNIISKLFFNTNNQLNLKILTKFKRNVKYHNSWINIQYYLNNRYNDSKTLKETLYRILYNIEIRPVCKSCGNEVEFIGKNGKLFRDYCSNSCSANSKETINKKQQTQLKNWGTLHCYDSEKYQQYLLERRGAKYIYDLSEVKEKRKQTLITKYGTDKITGLEEIQNKIKNTYKERYGFTNPMFNENIKEKKYFTQKKNNSFNISKTEDESYTIIKEKFPDVIRQYKSDIYPFACDFYIPSLDLYIECNYHWTHGGKLFERTKEDNVKLELWKSKSTKYYNNAIKTWTNLDIKKYNIAKENKLNYKIFYNIYELKNWLEISLEYNEQNIKREIEFYKKSNGRYSITSTMNYIVKFYQQENFYNIEKKLWLNEDIKYKLLNNRKKYLNKDNFTSDELLRGFKISGIHYGYSHFNPLILKKFLHDNNVKICYDPCGGWGHRILGSLNIEKYIYNDLSYHTYKQCINMCKSLNIDNCDFYNEDANYFCPDTNFDAMFTCPPYYNIEEYECGIFESIEKYNEFIDNLFNIFYKKESCKIFGIIIREDLIDLAKHIPNTIIILNNHKSHYLNDKHKNNECLFIFNK